MKIIRASFGDTCIFTPAQLESGACCYYTEDKSDSFFFQINGVEATLHATGTEHIVAAIEEFLFYSGFICRVKDSEGKLLARREPPAPELTAISDIQPSQFFINQRKLDACKSWISAPEDVIIPVASIDGNTVSQDGHTRLRAALDLGFTHVYVYNESYDPCIADFVREAMARGVFSVADMTILSDEEYKIKWDKFCDDFFEREDAK